MEKCDVSRGFPLCNVRKCQPEKEENHKPHRYKHHWDSHLAIPSIEMSSFLIHERDVEEQRIIIIR